MNPTFGAISPVKPSAELTVSELNRSVARLIEQSLGPCTVRGELSNVVRASSGHWYFSLKDPGAQVRAVMFRGRAQYLGFAPREGQQVVARVVAGLYEPRGDFQLNVEAMRLAGAGDLHQQFVALKAKLQAEGLFEAGLKRPIPAHPRRIGVITSAQAAALRDVLSTLAARAPHIEVVIYPSLVQGLEAPAALRQALETAIDRNEVDVLLLVRGGGSMEDLWAFNDEALARLVRQTPFPVISGVGHETDFTIADFVADLRAPTPTGAAAAASPDRRVALASLQSLANQARRQMLRSWQTAEQQLDAVSRRLRLPSELWAAKEQSLVALAGRLRQAAHRGLERQSSRWLLNARRLAPPLLAPKLEAVARLEARLQRWPSQLDRELDHLNTLTHRLHQASPQTTLERGFAIVTNAKGEVVRSSTLLQPGEALSLRLAQGQVETAVLRTVQ